MVAESNNNQNENQIITFGCRLNIYESELIKQSISDLEQKNLVVFNSCAVTAQAERQLAQAIRKAKRENSAAKIVVTGCAAQINPEKYAKMKEVDFVLGNDKKSDSKVYEGLFNKDSSVSDSPQQVTDAALQNHQNTPDTSSLRQEGIQHQDQVFYTQKKSQNPTLDLQESEKILVNDIMSVKETASNLVAGFDNRTRAFLQIQNGCNHRCTFCIIPYGRGNSRSVPLGEIVTQVRKMVELGHKEVVLTGVDISDYGKDLLLPISLAQMVKRVLKLVPELPRLRLSSIDVAEIDEEMIDVIKNEKRLMPYLHISVQSGDDLILKRMKRRHTRAQVLKFCELLRKIRPEMTFGSDLIAGFPTESEEAFQNSVSLIQEAGIIFNHIFPYSPRVGTPAAKMPQLNGKVIKERARILREVGEAELNKFMAQQVDKKMKVIVEKIENGFASNFALAKSENFLDVKIDLAKAENQKVRSGEIFQVVIKKKENSFLFAKL